MIAIVAIWGLFALLATGQDGELPLGASEQIGSTSPDSSSSVTALTLSKDGKSLVVARVDGHLELWKLPRAERIRTLFDPAKEEAAARFGGQLRVDVLELLPDGKRVAGAGFGFGLRILDIETGKVLWQEPKGKEPLTLSPDAKTILVGLDFEGTLSLRDTGTGKEVASLMGHKRSVNSAAFSPNGKAVYTASRDRTVRKWDLATGRELWCVGEASADNSIGPTFPHCVALSSDGRWLAVSYHGCWDLGLQVFNASDGKVASTTGIGNSDAIVFLGQTNLLALQGKDDHIGLWDVELREMKGRSPGVHKGRVFAMASLPDGKGLITAGSDGLILMWDVSKFR